MTSFPGFRSLSKVSETILPNNFPRRQKNIQLKTAMVITLSKSI